MSRWEGWVDGMRGMSAMRCDSDSRDRNGYLIHGVGNGNEKGWGWKKKGKVQKGGKRGILCTTINRSTMTTGHPVKRKKRSKGVPEGNRYV